MPPYHLRRLITAEHRATVITHLYCYTVEFSPLLLSALATFFLTWTPPGSTSGVSGAVTSNVQSRPCGVGRRSANRMCECEDGGWFGSSLAAPTPKLSQRVWCYRVKSREGSGGLRGQKWRMKLGQWNPRLSQVQFLRDSDSLGKPGTHVDRQKELEWLQRKMLSSESMQEHEWVHGQRGRRWFCAMGKIVTHYLPVDPSTKTWSVPLRTQAAPDL